MLITFRSLHTFFTIQFLFIFSKETSSVDDDHPPTIRFLLYNPQNCREPEIFTHKQFNANNLQAEQPTIIIVPDYKQTHEESHIQALKLELLKLDVNLIILDWCDYKQDSYEATTKQLRRIAHLAGTWIFKIVMFEFTSLDKIHLIGFSMAAHLCGFIGKDIKRMTEDRYRLLRITGLDPSKHLFRDVDKSCRLDGNDAYFVDVYHTCSNILSTPEPIGSLDVYINNGISPQPGCAPDPTGIYSHYRVWDYFKESVGSNNFKAHPCFSYCGYISVGFQMKPLIANQIYCLDTNKQKPFALG